MNNFKQIRAEKAHTDRIRKLGAAIVLVSIGSCLSAYACWEIYTHTAAGTLGQAEIWPAFLGPLFASLGKTVLNR